MKKLLLTLGLAAFMLSAKSQIIITGYLADPSGTDADATGAKEYIQLRATEYINFATTPYAVVTCNNAGATGSNFPVAGWASGGSKTYQFSLNLGSVTAGEIFYVGGDVKTIQGGAAPASTDISGATWIVGKNYFSVAGDNGVGSGTGNILANSGNPAGIAVFATDDVKAVSIPIDAIFFGGTAGDIYQASPELGYRVPNNDLYNISNGEFFRKGTNTFIFPANVAGKSTFVTLGGDYNTTTKTWNVPRKFTSILLTASSTLSDIETGPGATTLPVSLTTFTAKSNKAGSVNLAWSTASEKDNAYFEVTRSTGGVNFSAIAKVTGSGTSNTLQNYNYTDLKPTAGTNYYRLKQVDNDGKSAFSKIVSATVGLGNGNLTVSVAANRNTVKVNYTAVAAGNASFTIFNASGVKIATVNKAVEVGQNRIEIPVALGSTIHILKATQAGLTSSTKF